MRLNKVIIGQCIDGVVRGILKNDFFFTNLSFIFQQLLIDALIDDRREEGREKQY